MKNKRDGYFFFNFFEDINSDFRNTLIQSMYRTDRYCKRINLSLSNKVSSLIWICIDFPIALFSLMGFHSRRKGTQFSLYEDITGMGKLGYLPCILDILFRNYKQNRHTSRR